MLSNIRGTKKSATSKMGSLQQEFFLFYLSFLLLNIHKTWDSMGRGTPWVTRLYHFQPLH